MVLDKETAQEIWDIYDKYRNFTGRTHIRGVELEQGDFHLVVHVWIKNSKNQYLITKRTPNKTFPNMWAATGGSAIKGESSQEAAIREVKEETGLQLLPKNGLRLFSFRRSSDFGDVWLFEQDFDLADVVLQEGETCDAKWLTIEEINKLIEANIFVDSLGLEVSTLKKIVDSQIKLVPASKEDGQKLFELQREVFLPLYEKYQDHLTSPVTQKYDTFLRRFDRGDYYKIFYFGVLAGAVFVYKISDGIMRFHIINIKKAFENKSIAQNTMLRLIDLYPQADVWELETILQEKKNCYLYEKLGFVSTGETKTVNKNLTLIKYIKKKQ